METGSQFSYYEILEISPHCPQHEITTAYERMRQTYSGGNPAIYTMFTEAEARELLKLVEEAYSVLGNKTLRALYDEKVGQVGKKFDLSFEALQTESKVVFNESPKKVTSAKVEYKVDADFEKELKEIATWDGAQLKKVREYKKFSLEKISEITKVSSYYINAIENVDPTNLPAPVFVRGYVSQISKVLGLDEKKVCDSYMKIFKEKLGQK